MKMNTSFKFLAAALMVTAAPWLSAPVAAVPISSSLGLQNALASSVETVQYRRGYRGYRAGRPYGYGYGPGYVYAPRRYQPYYGSPAYQPYYRSCPPEYASRPELCGRY